MVGEYETFRPLSPIEQEIGLTLWAEWHAEFERRMDAELRKDFRPIGILAASDIDLMTPGQYFEWETRREVERAQQTVRNVHAVAWLRRSTGKDRPWHDRQDNVPYVADPGRSRTMGPWSTTPSLTARAIRCPVLAADPDHWVPLGMFWPQVESWPS